LVIAFLDANAFVYVLEGAQPWAEAVKTELRRLAAAQDPEAGSITRLGLSRLSWLECRVGPLRRGDQAALQRFDAFFARTDLCWVELNAAVVEQATNIRACHNLRTADALQAASCLQLGPDAVMITGDSAFARVPGLPLALVS
jgi:predicted nucleic acid-binding protein